ncbi:MAG: hypothetical protein ABFR53_08975 [Actinomycetota bacterium]
MLFISYAAEDGPFVRSLSADVTENGQGYFKAASHDGFAVLFQWVE